MSEDAAAPDAAGTTSPSVVFVTQIFPPEMGALANRMHPLARHLASAGMHVTVATGMPNYPEGRIFPEYRGRRSMSETIDGIEVQRTRSYTAARNVTQWSQLRAYLSFLPAAFRSAMRAPSPDVVFVTSPPLFPAVAAAAVARLRGARLILDLRDLWPDEIVACEAAEEGSAPVRAIRLLERWSYRRADAIACTTQAFIDTIVERGVPREKAFLLPNGADIGLFRPLDADNPVAAEYPFGDRFVVMYSGLLGIKHGLESLIDAAEHLRDREDIVLFLRGSGPRREALVEDVARRGLTNVLFGGERPVQDLPLILARADACVTNLLPDAYLEKIVSVKVFEYMACAKPVIGALRGEGARIIEQARAGLVVPPGDGRAIADAIRRLADDQAGARAMGEAGLAHVRENYSREATAQVLEDVVRRLAGDGRTGPRRPHQALRVAWRSLVGRGGLRFRSNPRGGE